MGFYSGFFIVGPAFYAELHRQGILTDKEALWYYLDEERVGPNKDALFDENNEPNF